MDELNPAQWALLPLKKYATFTGRAPRAEYWWYYLGTVVGSILIDIVAGTRSSLGTLYSVLLLAPTVAVAVRRLHDTDRNGWWLLVPSVAFLVAGVTAAGVAMTVGAAFIWLILAVLTGVIGAIALLVFMVLPGTQGPNRFGPDPYSTADDLEEVFA